MRRLRPGAIFVAMALFDVRTRFAACGGSRPTHAFTLTLGSPATRHIRAGAGQTRGLRSVAVVRRPQRAWFVPGPPGPGRAHSRPLRARAVLGRRIHVRRVRVRRPQVGTHLRAGKHHACRRGWCFVRKGHCVQLVALRAGSMCFAERRTMPCTRGASQAGLGRLRTSQWLRLSDRRRTLIVSIRSQRPEHRKPAVFKLFPSKIVIAALPSGALGVRS